MYYHPICPPFLHHSYDESLETHTEEIRRLVDSFDEVTVLLYDIVEEPSREQPFREKEQQHQTTTISVLTPKPRYDTVQYLSSLRFHIGLDKNVKWCLFRAIRPDDTLFSLQEWYHATHHLFDALVLTGNHWNPLKMEHVYPALPRSTKKLGAVLIPHRPEERARVLQRKNNIGVDFFVTQLQLYWTREWQEFVEMLGSDLVTLTTVPSSKRQLDFLETLGVQTRGYDHHVDNTLTEKMRHCLELVRTVPFGLEMLPESKKSRVALLDTFLEAFNSNHAHYMKT